MSVGAALRSAMNLRTEALAIVLFAFLGVNFAMMKTFRDDNASKYNAKII